MRHGKGNGMGGLDHSICPGAPVPVTMLVAVMSDGSYLLVGYPQGEPSAFVIAEDAVTLQQALDTAFGSRAPTGQEDAAAGGELIRGKAAQP